MNFSRNMNMNTDLSETVSWWGEALVEVKERMVSSAANLFDQIEGRCRPEPNKYTDKVPPSTCYLYKIVSASLKRTDLSGNRSRSDGQVQFTRWIGRQDQGSQSMRFLFPLAAKV